MIVPYAFSAGDGIRKARKKATHTRPYEPPLCRCNISLTQFSQGLRELALYPWVGKKSCLGKYVRVTELACLPVETETRKEVRSLVGSHAGNSMNGCRGSVTRSSQRIAGFRCGYTRFNATAKIGLVDFEDYARTQASSHCPTVGAPSDPRYGCAVNTTESASGLVRFTQKVSLCVAPTGGEVMPEAQEHIQ